jgi:hypothetical protein
MIMSATKTLMLAGLAALSLSVGTAMAQEGGGPSMATIDYWAAKTIAAQAQAVSANQGQSGSSEVDTVRSGGARGAAVHYDYGTLANPG